MLIPQEFLSGIRNGTVTLAFRRWRRPTVRTGGTLLTAIGQLQIVSVDPTSIDVISEADACRAGYASRDALLEELGRRPDGRLYRIEFGGVRPDPRVALREEAAQGGELSDLIERLHRLDVSFGKPWTRQVLELVRSHPGVRAADLCAIVGQQRDLFKTNVRKLKKLGLTESLEIGYRLSPRGASLLEALASARRDDST